MRQKNKCFELAVIFVVSGVLVLDFLFHQYDKFHPYNLTMESPKTDYRVGERVKLIASVVSDKPATIRVYKDRRKSFSLSIRATSGRDLFFSGALLDATAHDAIEVIEIKPDKPFQLELQGQILPTKSKEIIFDFGRFGTFKKRGPGNFRVFGYWRPILPDPIDSDGDSTEAITLRVTLPNK
jgi:hypothetical protein